MLSNNHSIIKSTLAITFSNISNSIFELYEDSGLQALPKHHTILCLVQATQDSLCPGYNNIWMVGYLRPTFQGQKKLVEAWHSSTDRFKPFMNILMINLSRNPNETVKPIKGGFRTDVKFIANIKSL